MRLCQGQSAPPPCARTSHKPDAWVVQGTINGSPRRISTRFHGRSPWTEDPPTRPRDGRDTCGSKFTEHLWCPPELKKWEFLAPLLGGQEPDSWQARRQPPLTRRQAFGSTSRNASSVW